MMNVVTIRADAPILWNSTASFLAGGTNAVLCFADAQGASTEMPPDVALTSDD